MKKKRRVIYGWMLFNKNGTPCKVQNMMFQVFDHNITGVFESVYLVKKVKIEVVTLTD